MKKVFTLFVIALLANTAYSQQPILWGLTSAGGAGNHGSVFNVLANGDKFKVNYSFPESKPGASPQRGKLLKATDGLFYGLTCDGGAFDVGVLFSFNPATNEYTSLVDFSGSDRLSPGAHPFGGLIQAADGKLYGMTNAGGSDGMDQGVIFSYDISTKTYVQCYQFSGGSGGSHPQGTLLQASNGLLYGMTMEGGNSAGGDIFTYDPLTFTFTELADFSGDFYYPYGSLIQAPNGLLYGTTYSGHIFSSDLSGHTNLLVTTDGNGSFPGGSMLGDLLLANNGLLYGLSCNGGAYDKGVLFSYNIGTATYKDEYDFDDEYSPIGSLIQASNGLLYGLTPVGGASGKGVIFTYNISSDAYTEIHAFNDADGATPNGSFMQNGNGLLYAMTCEGGASGSGTLLSLSLSNTFTSILSFKTGQPFGAEPQSSLVKASNGQLYGLATYGGTNGVGALFTVNPDNGAYTYLHSFTGNINGRVPAGTLIQATNGLLYGVTVVGGPNRHGNIFSFDPAHPNNPPVNLYYFTATAPDYIDQPVGDLFQASNGLIYGMSQFGGVNTMGNIFSFDPANPNNPPVNLYSFDNGTPTNSLMQASNGLLYGMALNGGANGMGNIFSFDPAHPTNPAINLYDFTNDAPDYGAFPYGKLIQASNGLLYGMTEYGGGYGNIFSFDPAHPGNAPVNLVDLGTTSDAGTYPGGSLMQATDGNLYGMTYGGGANFSGVVFKYDYVNNIYSNVHDFARIEGQYSNYGSLIQVGVSTLPVDTFYGYTSSWATPSNWSMNLVPTDTIPVFIPSSPVGGHNPVITSTASVGNIQLNNGATLNIDSAASLLVYGSWTGGTATKATVTGKGTVQLVSGGTQRIEGRTRFQTLIANNSRTEVQAGASVDIYKKLVLQAGLFYQGNWFGGSNLDTVTLKATAANAYAMLQIINGSYSGFITDECYYNVPSTANSYNQHMMGSPIDILSLSQLNATGQPGYIKNSNCDETKSDNGSPYGTVFRYDEGNGSHCAIEGWEVLTGGATIDNGVGVSVARQGSGILSVTGRPNVNSSYTVDGNNSNWSNTTKQGHMNLSGWVLLSNPYPAPLHISSQTISQNLAAGWDAQIQVWNTTGSTAGSYQPTTFLAPFQAFMAHISNPGSATFTFNSSDQVYNTMPVFYKDADTQKLIITATNLNTQLTDISTVGFNPAATANFDPAYDMDKIPGSLNRHTLYTSVGSRWLGTNILKSIEETNSVPMGFEPGATGSYTLHFEGLSSFDATSYITLQDKKLNVTYDVRKGDYNFTADSADNWDRFVLLFTPAAQIITTAATCTIPGTLSVKQDGIANWTYTLTDASDTTVSNGTLNANSAILVDLAPGQYTLKLDDGNGYIVTKAVQITGDENIIAAFDSVATSVVNQIVNFTSTTANATTNTWNFGDGNTGTGESVSHTYTAPGTYTVSLTSISDSGCSSTVAHTITVGTATTVQNLSNKGIRIWSSENLVNVSFAKVEAGTVIKIYNALGQQLVNEQVTTGTLYTKVIPNMEAGYLFVTIKSGEEISTAKVFISNSK